MASNKPLLTLSSGLVLGLTVVVNWFVIAAFLSLFFPRSYFTLSVLTVFALAGLSLTPVGENIARFYFRCRRPVREELAQLEGPWNAVVRACGLADRQYKPELFVSDQVYPNAFAVGTQTVCVTRGLLKVATPDEIAGVLAHEVGHLENGDTRRRIIAAVINSAGNVATAVLTAILVALGVGLQVGGRLGGGQRSPYGIGQQMVVWGLLASALALFLKACLWGMQWLIQLGFLAVGRREELAADDFAKKAGFAEGLVGFLRKTETLDIQPMGIWAAVTRTHPPVPVRIDRLLYGPPAQ